MRRLQIIMCVVREDDTFDETPDLILPVVICLSQKIKPCMSKYHAKYLYCETANGSLNQQ